MEEERTTTGVDEAALLEAYAERGDVEALGRLIEAYRRPLRGYIARHAAGEADAEECYQETWLRALRGLERFRREHFGAWLFRIARNWLIDEGRRKKPAASLDAPAGEEGETTLGETVAAEGTRPDEASERRDLGSRIRAASEELPEAQREVFWLRMETGLSFREIAAVQGCPLGTALARMRRALGRMRELLADEWRDFCGGEP
jgi:RNA polymerase sigma-70 factor (ECF subfamily)